MNRELELFVLRSAWMTLAVIAVMDFVGRVT